MKITANDRAVAANSNEKKVSLSERFNVVKTHVSKLSASSKQAKVKETQNAIIDASKKRIENYEAKAQRNETDYRELTVEVTHAKYNASLLDLDAKAVKYTIDKNINLASAVNESREYKKRLKSFLEACANSDASKLDKALAKLQTHLKTSDAKTISVQQVATIMEHSTTTQASYFKKFGTILGVVSSERSNQVPMTINRDNEVFKDFVSL